jgi:hypothetical protein
LTGANEGNDHLFIFHRSKRSVSIFSHGRDIYISISFLADCIGVSVAHSTPGLIKIMIFLKKSKKSDLFDLNRFFDFNRYF